MNSAIGIVGDSRMEDVKQGFIGNCSFVAAVASIPDTVRGNVDRMITVRENDFLVRTYKNTYDPATNSYSMLPKDISIPKSIMTSKHATHPQVVAPGKLWPKIMICAAMIADERWGWTDLECSDVNSPKFFGRFLDWGGWPHNSIMKLTGLPVKNYSVSSECSTGFTGAASEIRTALASGRPVLTATRSIISQVLIDGRVLVPSHAYTISGISADGASVTLYNPHGYVQTIPVRDHLASFCNNFTIFTVVQPKP